MKTSHHREYVIVKKSKFIHVGCGYKTKSATTRGFNSENWTEIRFDIDPDVNPDVVGSMTEMSTIVDNSVDAIFSSHNIEHLYPHEVPLALNHFNRVLNSRGYVVITCPDLQSVAALVAEDCLTDTAYNSPAGPITPLDILYGHRVAMAKGNLYMAHRCGFTQKVLTATLLSAGFKKTILRRRPSPYYDLWAIATKFDSEDKELHKLAEEHFPN